MSDLVTIKVPTETRENTDKVQAHFPQWNKYEIVNACVKFFAETGFNPFRYEDNFTGKELEKLGGKIDGLEREIKHERKTTGAFIKQQEKMFLKPVQETVYEILKSIKTLEGSNKGELNNLTEELSKYKRAFSAERQKRISNLKTIDSINNIFKETTMGYSASISKEIKETLNAYSVEYTSFKK